MKQYASIFMLLARSVVYKMLGLFVLVAGLESAVFYYLAPGQLLEDAFDHGLMKVPFILGMVLLSRLLCGALSDDGGKIDYTLRRLRVSGRYIFAAHTLFNVLCLLVYWFFHGALALVLCRIWEGQQGEISNLTVFLAFYRSEFLHTVLPLHSAGRWGFIGTMLASLGLVCAYYPVVQRRGKPTYMVTAMSLAVSLTMFRTLREGHPIMVTVFSFLAAFVCSIMLFGGEFQDDEDETLR